MEQDLHRAADQQLMYGAIFDATSRAIKVLLFKPKRKRNTKLVRRSFTVRNSKEAHNLAVLIKRDLGVNVDPRRLEGMEITATFVPDQNKTLALSVVTGRKGNDLLFLSKETHDDAPFDLRVGDYILSRLSGTKKEYDGGNRIEVKTTLSPKQLRTLEQALKDQGFGVAADKLGEIAKSGKSADVLLVTSKNGEIISLIANNQALVSEKDQATTGVGSQLDLGNAAVQGFLFDGKNIKEVAQLLRGNLTAYQRAEKLYEHFHSFIQKADDIIKQSKFQNMQNHSSIFGDNSDSKPEPKPHEPFSKNAPFPDIGGS